MHRARPARANGKLRRKRDPVCAQSRGRGGLGSTTSSACARLSFPTCCCGCKPSLGVAAERVETHTVVIGEVPSQLLEHRDSVSTAYHLGMHREREDPVRTVLVGPVEVAAPDLGDRGRGGEPCGVRPYWFEGWEVVEPPRDRQFEEGRITSEDERFIERPAVVAAEEVRVEVLRHATGVIGESVL